MQIFWQLFLWRRYLQKQKIRGSSDEGKGNILHNWEATEERGLFSSEVATYCLRFALQDDCEGL